MTTSKREAVRCEEQPDGGVSCDRPLTEAETVTCSHSWPRGPAGHKLGHIFSLLDFYTRPCHWPANDRRVEVIFATAMPGP